MKVKPVIVLLLSVSLMHCNSPSNQQLPRVYTVGDSTVKNGQGDGAGGLWGWGDFLGQFLDTTQVKVKNHAMGGTSSRTYIQMGLWQKVLDSINKGDYVLIQFGHNDNGPINDDFRARGTIKGIGEEKEEIDNMLTGRHEIVHTYGWYLRKMIRETKEKGGIPIIMSPIPRNNWKDAKVVPNNTTYGLWAEQVAAQENISFVDLNQHMAVEMEELGEGKIIGNLFYERDHTHTTAKGAVLAAKIISQQIKASGNPLKDYVLDNPIIEYPKKKDIYLIGDSTVANNGLEEAVGWGVELEKFMDTTRVRILNRARGGRSSRTFYHEKLWKAVFDSLQPGDYVFMQFGHNDAGHIDQPKYRGSIKGIGDSTVVVTKDDQSKEVVHSYGWYMTHFIRQAQSKKAIVVVLTSIPRNIWNGGKIERNDITYGLWAKQVAELNQVALIDLNDSIARAYEQLGPDQVKLFFPRDHTHTNSDGATFNASILAECLKRDQKLGLQKVMLGQKHIEKLRSNALKLNMDVGK